MSSSWDWNWVPPRNHTMHSFLLQKWRQSYSADTFATQQQKEWFTLNRHINGHNNTHGIMKILTQFKIISCITLKS